MTELALLGISGSLRAASTNTKLVHQAARHFGTAQFMLADLHLPLFDQDIQDGPGIPSEVQLLADQIAFADAVVISTPEYNKAISGVLKNALDWVSRTEGNPWRDKPVAVMSSAAGRAGGERSQWVLRLCLNPFRPHVLPGPEMHLAGPTREFTDDGDLPNELYQKVLKELMKELRSEALRRKS
ncbi:NADPH-dependent FMN reductase [Primorskyibacter marinus]|uniref:NADPH-dependent FMN reductase n=1 Tax=Primorskyibacter marinus TaxID=1977320 RepID=UPI000E309395|nr:NAD(P)H-dependent oxidoreductase [Primorskyibacter marinus]